MSEHSLLQRGFALVSALFLLVVLGALGVYMVSISSTEHFTSMYALQSAKAYYSARAGIEWGAVKASTATACNPQTTTSIAPGGALSGFTVIVKVACTGTYQETQLSNPYFVYTVDATAYTTSIAFGSLGYASRHILVTITTAP